VIPIRDTIPSRSVPVVTWMLILVNAVVFLYELTLSPQELERLFYVYGIVPARYTHPGWARWAGLSMDEYWPFLTSMFLHGGWYLDVDCEPLGENPTMPREARVFVPDMAGKNLATTAFLGGIPGLPLFRDAADACMAVFDAVIEGQPVDGNMFHSVGPKMLWRLCRRHRVHLRRWQRWMANVHPDSPLIHRHLSSWQGQQIHVEESPGDPFPRHWKGISDMTLHLHHPGQEDRIVSCFDSVWVDWKMVEDGAPFRLSLQAAALREERGRPTNYSFDREFKILFG
jgi:hypothetical protein